MSGKTKRKSILINHRLFRVILIFFSSIFFTGSVFAALADAYDLGAKGVGMVGARTAIVSDWSSGFYNLAGFTAPPLKVSVSEDYSKKEPKKINLLETDEDKRKASKVKTISELGFAYAYQLPFMNVDLQGDANPKIISGAQSATNNLNYGMLNVGFSFDLRRLFHIYRDMPVVLGATLALNADGSVQENIVKNHIYHNFREIGSNARQLTALFGLSVQPWKDRLSIGLGSLSKSKISGAVQVKNLDLFEKIVETNLEVIVGGEGFVPLIGSTYRHPLNNQMALMFALTYKGERYAITEITAEIIEPILYSAMEAIVDGLAGYSPHIVKLGNALLYNQYIFTLDLEMHFWSGFFVPAAQIKQMGSAPQFDNIFVIRAGAELPLKISNQDFIFRGGLGFVPAYTPDQTGYSNYLDNNKLLFGLGVSYDFKNVPGLKVPMSLDFGLQYQLWLTRESIKQAGNLNFPSYSYGGGLLIANLSMSVKF